MKAYWRLRSMRIHGEATFVPFGNNLGQVFVARRVGDCFGWRNRFGLVSGRDFFRTDV